MSDLPCLQGGFDWGSDWGNFTCSICKRRLSVVQMKRITKVPVVQTENGMELRFPRQICIDCDCGRQGSAN